MKARLKKKIRKTWMLRVCNPKLRILAKSSDLKRLHVVRADVLMPMIHELQRRYPCEESIVELRKVIATHQDTLYSIIGGKG
jgi:hypothetical protein